MSIHTENIDTDNLVPTETDMLVGLVKNTDKVVSSNKRWEFADHRHDKSDNHSDDDDLDADVDDYVDNGTKNVFKKDLTDKNDDHGHSNNSTSKHGYITTDTSTVDTSTDNRTDAPADKPMTKEELMLQKLDMLRKLGELKQCGVHLSQNYNLDSDLKMMQYEYKLHHDIRSKQNSVQWMSHMLIGVMKGTEMLNDNYNPFDIKLAGLSDKISSDMHNYYTVLGDIYEKYNQPGKQMAPEMRLLLMISGAALSMQVNRALPGVAGMMGGMSKTIKSDEGTLRDLRQKAEADTYSMDGKTRDYMKKQHDTAAQKVSDLKMIKEKELEHQRLVKMMDQKNTNMKQFKDQLILSTESPRDRSRPVKNRKTSEKPPRYAEQVQEKEQEPEHYLSPEEIEHIRKMKYRDEQAHLEMLRQMAHKDSENFRHMNGSNDHNEKRKRDLMRQDKHLDDILANVNNIGHADRVPIKKPTKTKTNTMSDARRSDSKSKSQKKSKIYSQESDNMSTSSSMSFNPKIESIMELTRDKAFKESQKKSSKNQKIIEASKSLFAEPEMKIQKIFTDKNTRKSEENKKVQNTKNVQKKVSKKVSTKSSDDTNTKTSTKSSTKSSHSKGNFKFNKTISSLLGEDFSDNDEISKEDISFGSYKNKKSGSKNSKGYKKSSNRTNDIVDFGTISFGSKQKGDTMKMSIGK